MEVSGLRHLQLKGDRSSPRMLLPSSAARWRFGDEGPSEGRGETADEARAPFEESRKQPSPHFACEIMTAAQDKQEPSNNKTRFSANIRKAVDLRDLNHLGHLSSKCEKQSGSALAPCTLISGLGTKIYNLLSTNQLLSRILRPFRDDMFVLGGWFRFVRRFVFFVWVRKSLPIYGNSSHVWETRIYRKFSHT
jgi:hypothetical protein